MTNLLRRSINRLPGLAELLVRVRRRLTAFAGSRDYWESRYRSGGNSGPGSYGRLAEFKAATLNRLIKQYQVTSVIDFGCGDGNQLAMIEAPSYIGLDVSKDAIGRCKARFHGDSTKSFFLYDPLCFVDRHQRFRADTAISLDVIQHLVEDEIFEEYMSHLFAAARRLVIIYSMNHPGRVTAHHVRDREFTPWVERHAAEWTMIEHVENKYPFDPKAPDSTSPCAFFVFQRDNVHRPESDDSS